MSAHHYTAIIEHYEDCLAQHGDTHLGVDWPNPRDAEKRYRVMLEVVREDSKGLTLLDFGCGASHLYPYMLNSRYAALQYHGLDASNAFCELSRSKYPQNDYFCLDVLEAPERLGEFDYVVMNGVFTEKRELTFDEMFEYFKRVLRVVFPRVRRGLAFNVMSKAVDWERDDLFHLPADLLIAFLTKELSRHFVIRNDYGLYEYTVYVYKEAIHV
ncbi:MAG TPA: class I SAM-dependent methyltransferase [Gallionella sp.]|nr:class I SAM-dependent methyltransferase [Gallionella sp.]